MTEFSLSNARPLLHELADAAALETLPHFRATSAVINKEAIKGAPGFDPVTEADRQGEVAIRKVIERYHPDHGIIGEEHDAVEGTSGFRWVIDPVDGTRAYISGVPVWTTLVGLERDGALVAGMIDQPFLKERWIGVSGEGTEFSTNTGRGMALVSKCENISDARFTVTDMRPGSYFHDDEVDRLFNIARQCKVVRQGLDAYGFGLIASGHLDLCIEAGLHWHDIAAVVPVIEAAGGVACTWDGQPIREGFERGRCVLAATRKLADEACALLSK